MPWAQQMHTHSTEINNWFLSNYQLLLAIYSNLFSICSLIHIGVSDTDAC